LNRSFLLGAAGTGIAIGLLAGRWQLDAMHFGTIGSGQATVYWGFFVLAGVLLVGAGGLVGWALGAIVPIERRSLSLLTGVLAAAGAFAHFVPSNVRERPNVFMLVSDTMRADHMSLYGYERPTTPFLEEYAAQSVVFTNSMSQGSSTIVTTPSILGSCYPSEHGLKNYQDVLAEDHVLISESLQWGGYQTIGVVTNPHLAERNGFAQGFDHYELFGSGNAAAVFAETVNERFFLRLDAFTGWEPPADAGEVPDANGNSRGRAGSSSGEDRAGGPGGRGNADSREEPSEGDADSETAGDGAEAEEDSEDAEWDEPPIFGFIFYTDPHTPYETPGDYPRLYDPDWAGKDYVYWWQPKKPKPDEKTFFNLIAQYDASITYLDSQLRALFEGLEERGLMDNALVVFTSDHGEEFFEHDGYGHGFTLFEEVVHVPLLVSFPSPIRFPPLPPISGFVEDVVASVDIMPTVLDYLRIPIDPAASGRSAVDVAAGRKDPAGERVAYLEQISSTYGNYDLRAIRTRDRKCIIPLVEKDAVGPQENLFFDLEDDPEELNNLVEEREEEAGNYLDLLASRINRMVLLEAGEVEQIVPSAARREHLRALGYIE
jgi:arylsulfatase A-like enzyme